MHFDDSAESIADSDLEDGEFQKMLTSPLYAQKASGKPDAMVVEEREVSAQYTQAGKESLRSPSSEGQKAWGKPNALCPSEQGNLIRSSVFGNANPSKCIGETTTTNGKNEDWRYRTHNTDLLSPDENKYDIKRQFSSSLPVCNKCKNK